MSSGASLVEECETAVAIERADSVGSDVYLLKDPLLNEDEQTNSDSVDAGSEDNDSAEAQIKGSRSCCHYRRCGLAVVFSTVLAVFVVAAVVVVVILSVTSLQRRPSVLSQPDGLSSWDETVPTDPVEAVPTTSPSRPSVLMLSDGCSFNIVGDVDNGMFVFKGIPYALPPLGTMRWRHSMPYTFSKDKCKDIFDASQFGSSCMQMDSEGQTISGSEDCLFLNVWTRPEESNPSSNRDVLVYFHGGGLVTGSGHEVESLPTSELLSDSNAVVVSFNYRLNAFGFLSLETLTAVDGLNASGNYGIMDQIVALQWVQQNIRLFGGNPNSVTLFGHGSGATSIYALLASSLARGLFHRVWISNPSPKLESFRTEAEQQNANFINNTSCTGGESETRDLVVEASCLRGLTAETVIRALPWQQWLNNQFYKIPTFDETSIIIATIDGFVLKDSPLEAWQKKTFNDVPLLISSAAQATDVQKLNDWQQYNYADYVRQRLMSFSDFDLDIKQVYRLYDIGSASSDPELCDATLVSDIRATCPIDEMARLAASASKSPVYRFQSKYHSATPSSGMKNYAYSGIDVHAFFNSAGLSSPPSWVQFVHNIRSIVFSFIHSTSTVGSWQRFPRAIYNVSDVISRAELSPPFLSQQCLFWRDNGFFPEYAWMN